MTNSKYQPPYSLTDTIINQVAEIIESTSLLKEPVEQELSLRLRKVNRMRTVQGSLAIEGNTLSVEQIIAIMDGKRVIAPIKEVQEAHNALTAYDLMDEWAPASENDLLQAHRAMMIGLQAEVGVYRSGSVGVMSGNSVVHMAPQAARVPQLMRQLFNWLRQTKAHPLIVSSVFHYEFEFIHPFADGNGRIGRLWQSLILSKWQDIFKLLPIESMVYQKQQDYYSAIGQSTKLTDCAPFIEFMLAAISSALSDVQESSVSELSTHDTPQDLPQAPPQETPQVTPQVEKLVATIFGEMSRTELQSVLMLKDRKSFVETYLQPALQAKVIEMTLPQKPTSKWQKYRLTGSGKVLKHHLNSKFGN